MKGNNRVILIGKMRGFETEAKLEMMRQELKGVFERYTREKCGPRGLQKSNLTRNEILGLKSLKKRVKEGEIVILPTDKTGLFAVMSRDTYLECGTSHTEKDSIVGWDDLKQSQNEINGHTSMMIKIFDIGRAWDHTSRVRETMLGEAMATCPLSLLYKDHKGWNSGMGTVPPTRPVAGGHMGMNLHLSEVVSDLIEPLVDKYEGGKECISTEDMIAKVVDMNVNNKGWTRWTWWEGQTCEDYVGCGKCEGDWMLEFKPNEPEMCSCGGVVTMGRYRVTARWLKRLRRTKWEELNNWDPTDEGRTWSSTEVLPEDLQNYQVPMVIMGFDVVSLYPNLDIEKVGERVRKTVLKSNIKWEGINYLEAVRYIALNWPEDKCRQSKLRRVLPWRRKHHGTRPGVRGEGPRGPIVGDQEQWVFPRVTLTPEDKLEIVGTVLSIATTSMFHHHYYSFGGKMYRQDGGGPIGLRGTCAIARLMMQIFDEKWEGRLKELCIRIWLNTRYMDDGRTAMPPIKPGWRWVNGSLLFNIKWEREDQELTDIEITKRVILGTLNGVEDYLKFTIETEEDFEDKWLPTLDTKLRVDGSNQVLHAFYEKPTNSNLTVQRRSAMGEDAKIQILSNDLIRRLMNNSEELGRGARTKVVDDYTQKLMNSGFKGEQLKRIIVNGIKGYEGKLRRCKEQGRRLHRTSTDSQGARVRKKLLAKANWFKNKKRTQGAIDTKVTKWNGNPGAHRGRIVKDKELELKSVLFVEQTPKGELASRLREAMRSMEQTLGFKIKVVERSGRSLGSKFPLGNLWDGNQCGRRDCVTCEQGGEDLPNCTKTNLVYENICVDCNPGARKKDEEEQIRVDIPTVYIGETSRSLYERAKEHYDGARKGEAKNHMVKHNLMEHGGEQKPNFNMKARKYFRTALARQVAEAVLIRRRGGEGAILNSKGEFNRSYIPRLQVEEEPEGAEEERRKGEEQTNRLLKELDGDWEEGKARELGATAILGPMSSPKKRGKGEQEQTNLEDGEGRRMKRLKHSLIGRDWGELPVTQGAGTPPPPLQPPDGREPNQPVELTGSEVPREQSLRQTRLTGFLDPAASLAGSPTTRNLGPAIHLPESKEENPLENVKITVSLRVEADQTKEDLSMDQNIGFNEQNTDRGVNNTALDVAITTPSSGSCTRTAKLRKPEKTAAVVGIPDSVAVDGENTEVVEPDEACTFKRGGMCIKHKCVGQKYEISSKVWTQKKDGMFGYKTVKQTKYRCRFKGVPVTNSRKPGPKVGKQTRVTSSLGDDAADYKLGKVTISGDYKKDYSGAGANKSESFSEQSDKQENG